MKKTTEGSRNFALRLLLLHNKPETFFNLNFFLHFCFSLSQYLSPDALYHIEYLNRGRKSGLSGWQARKNFARFRLRHSSKKNPFLTNHLGSFHGPLVDSELSILFGLFFFLARRKEKLLLSIFASFSSEYHAKVLN
jgi:hypothetical protein